MFITNKKKKEYEDELAKLRHKIEELTQIVKTQELLRLRAENERLKEKEKLMKNVHMKVKSVSYIPEDNIILVKYDIAPARVPVNEEGQVQKNDFFYAVNKLQLISFDDMSKIQAVINQLKKEGK